MMTDTDCQRSINESFPEHIEFNALLKATPATEGNDRIIYVEASKEEKDQQNEIVLAKALKESVSHFMKFGVVDLDHKSMPSVAQKYGIENPDEWAVGQPVDVRFDGDTTMVKAKLYSGDTHLAHRANIVWDGLTKLNPPARYYASVGGSVLSKSVKVDPDTNERVAVVTAVRWNNLALSMSPVNQHLGAATSSPMGVFAKSLNAFVLKGLDAGYGTDSATLVGGGALRAQSIDGDVYSIFKDKLAGMLRSRDSSILPKRDPASLTKFVSDTFGMDATEARKMVERFLNDLKTWRRK